MTDIEKLKELEAKATNLHKEYLGAPRCMISPEKINDLRNRYNDAFREYRAAADNTLPALLASLATKWPDYIEESRKANTRAEAAESRLTTALAALERIYRFGDGYSEHRPEQGKFAGTTGQGHAECREIARAALAKLNEIEGQDNDDT